MDNGTVTSDRFSVITDGLPSQLPDFDPEETREWLESLDAVINEAGRGRARYLMLRLLERARERQVGVPALRSTDYINTIPPEREPWFPGDEYVERRIRAYIRWNAAVMVSRANRPGIGVGGHIATYASAASLYEVGFNHFFRGKDHGESGDQVFFQGHASPGIYARAFLEGRLDRGAARRLPAGDVARRRTGLPSLPAPAADAGLLGVPHRLDGPRPARARSTRPGSTATCWQPARSRTPRSRTCGRSSATARWTSPSRSARSAWPPARSWTTSPSSSTATCSASTARSAATARSSRSWSRTSAAPAGT